MKREYHPRSVLLAVALSALLNLLLALSAFAGVRKGERNLFGRIADAIAAPPGIIANALFAPKQHSVHAFAFAAVMSLICSFVFYALLIWGVLEFSAFWKAHQRQDLQ